MSNPMSEHPDATRTEPGQPVQGPDMTGPYNPVGPATRAQASPEPSSGTARYRFGAEIGRGGMGVVVEAIDGELERHVAVKVLQEGHRGEADLTRRFVDEARIAGRLQHPGVVPVYELGRLPDDRPFFTMKLVQGRTLADLLAARASPADELAHYLAVFEQVCQAMAYAHSKGVIHRDLKPSNVMVGAFGEVQVMDWGLAKVLGERRGSSPPSEPDRRGQPGGSPEHTHAGSVLGTPSYMAPEQARGETAHADERADVFGLGGILCAILTGRPPFESSGPDAHDQAAQADLAPALDRLQKCGADADLIALARACLEPGPERRPRDAGVVATTVIAYRESVERRLRETEVERAAAQARARAERRSRRLAWALAAAVLGLVVLGAGGWGWHERQQGLRRQHEAEVAAAVEDDLRQASEARARAASPDDEAWGTALAAVRRAEGRLAGHPDEALRGRVEATLDELGREQADRRMVRRLEDIRLLKVELTGEAFDWRQPAVAYQKAFRDYGVDVDKLSVQEAGARLRARPIRAELALALDDWSELYGHSKEGSRLRGVAQLADPDPTRQRLRAALESRNTQALLDLARSPGAAHMPAVSHAVLGRALAEVGEFRAGVDVTRRGQRLHPRDFSLNFLLAMQLASSQPAEAARFFTVALALRPRAPGVLVGLGNALLAAGNLDEAGVCFEQVLAVMKDLPLAHYNLGNVRSRQGRHTEAVAAYREAIRLRPGYVEALTNLGAALAELDRPDEAIAVLGQAITVRPGHAAAHLNLGMACELKGDIDRGIPAFRSAARLDPKGPLPRLYLGRMLQRKGQLREAVAVLRRADEVGAKTPGWGYPSREWLAEAERLLALEPRLPALLAGKVKPSSPEERLDWAQLCLRKDRPARAAVLYQEAFREKPALADTPDGPRFTAAVAAGRAGLGLGADAGDLDDRAQAAWRRQALEWLRAELAYNARRVAANPKLARGVGLVLSHWYFDVGLAGLRDSHQLKKLSADEQKQWQQFWDEVQSRRKGNTTP
jgi:serine/threonine-protein kinase